MKAIDLATRHYSRNARQFIDVPEWADDAGKPLRIWWKLPTLTQRERARSGSETDAEFIAALAETAEGERMFDAEDALKLRDGVDAAILTRIVLRMLAGATVTEQAVENARKN